MSLIDPATPEGNFHMRVVPYGDLLREKGVQFFAEGPDPQAETYFLPASGGDGIVAATGLLSGADVIKNIQDLWAKEDTALAAFGADLESLRLNLVADQAQDDEPELTDFVYPLF